MSGVLITLLLVVVAFTRAGHSKQPPGAVSAAPATPVPSSAEDSSRLPATGLAAALAGLNVAPSSDAGSYDRRAFGSAWTDTDRNGCDTRNDILRRDLVQVALKPGTRDCVVLSGLLHDPYSGLDIAFVKTRPKVQIDHVVALGDAWRSGAHSWPYAKLLAFANDPLNLLAVSGALNQAKSDSDASLWLPPHGDCDYVARQVAVKAKYELAVTPAERRALAAVAAGCGTEVVPSGGNPTLATNRQPSPRASAP